MQAEQINALLPQTQCGQCGFKGCLPYAEAIAAEQADINQCPPGGDEGINDLAALLGLNPKPLNPQFGQHKPKQVAFIDEASCIGCVKCIAACPVDAIVGAAKLMHTVIAAECTGCELCIAPCPVDCIVMQAPPHDVVMMDRKEKSALAKRRFEQRAMRLQKLEQDKQERINKQKAALAQLKSSGTPTQ